MMDNDNKIFRALSDWENKVLLRLLELDFPGRNKLLTQVKNLKARCIDENGSLEFYNKEPKSSPHKPIPTEAEAKDRDGISIHFLLFSVNGEVDMLEIYKDDSSKIQKLPEPKDLNVILLR